MILPNGKVHPVGELFPMLLDDELNELAEDIKTNGLKYPIVLDRDGQLIDGRNRLEACKRAGVEPTYIILDGDPVSYIISTNVNRRHLNKGQQAMAVAKAKVSYGKHFGDQQKVADDLSVGKKTVSQAFTVLEYAPEKADEVLAGSLSLNAAYDTACDRKNAAYRDEQQRVKLQLKAPHIFSRVKEEELSLDEGITLMEKEEERKRIAKESAQRLIVESVNHLLSLQGDYRRYDGDAITTSEVKQGIQVLEEICSTMNHQ